MSQVERVILVRADGTRQELGVAINFSADGLPICELPDVAAEGCDHKGQTWSDEMELRCVKCGARLFVPGRYLAGLASEVIEEMHRLWRAAGRPHHAIGSDGWWSSGECYRYDTDQDTFVVAGQWTLLQPPLFAKLGGLPVHADKLESFQREHMPACLELDRANAWPGY